MPAPIPISYLNTSSEAIPPFAAVQLSGDNEVTAAKTQSVKVVKPTGAGPYMLDMGQGAAISGAAAYSQCCTPISHTWWAYYLGASAPGPAWTTEIGPVSGAWDLQTGGSGFLYAGHLDVANQRILVMQKPAGGAEIVRFTMSADPEDIDCTAGTAVATLACSGKEVLLCDPNQEWLTGATDFLTNRRGLATPNVAECETCEQPDPYNELPLYTIISMFSPGYQCN